MSYSRTIPSSCGNGSSRDDLMRKGPNPAPNAQGQVYFEMSDQLFAAALSAVSQTRIITLADFQIMQQKGLSDGYRPLDPVSFHQTQLMTGQVHSEIPIVTRKVPTPTGREMVVRVKTLTGDQMLVECDSFNNLREITGVINQNYGHLPEETKFIFGGRTLNEDQTLCDYNIRSESILHLAFKDSLIYIPNGMRDPRFDYDYTKTIPKDVTYKQGMYFYRAPSGWMRLAFNVLDRFADNIWLGGGRAKGTEMGLQEWPITYHGTGITKRINEGIEKPELKSQFEDGYAFCKKETRKRPSRRRPRKQRSVPSSLFDHGIYTAPDIHLAEDYASTFFFENDTYKVVLQSRVNPQTVKMLPRDKPNDIEIWITQNEQDVRPFGICVKKVPRF